MRTREWMHAVMLMLSLPLAAASEPGQTQWKLANFTWVKRVPAEAGAPANAQPAAVTPEVIQATLAPVQATLEGHEQSLFTKDELKPLAKALSEALALAQPGEDVILLSTFKRGGGFMEMAVGLTARLFVRDGALNLLVQDARLPFMDRYSADRTLPTFTYGSRTAASTAVLQAPGATRLRADWLVLPLATAPPAPVPVSVAAPAAPAKAVVEPTAGALTPADYEAMGQRLKALKKLRDENLISEAEYQERRAALMKQF